MQISSEIKNLGPLLPGKIPAKKGCPSRNIPLDYTDAALRLIYQHLYSAMATMTSYLLLRSKIGCKSIFFRPLTASYRPCIGLFRPLAGLDRPYIGLEPASSGQTSALIPQLKTMTSYWLYTFYPAYRLSSKALLVFYFL